MSICYSHDVNTDPTYLIDVLKKGNISEIIIEAGDSTITITISKTDEAELMNCIIPIGLTKFGFIENSQIFIGGNKYSKTYTSTWTSFSISSSVQANNLDSEGFSIEMDESIPISIPKDETSKQITVKGKLLINVPSGYSTFMLSGLSGIINSGKIVIKKFNKNEKQKHLFEIEYGNMTVTNNVGGAEMKQKQKLNVSPIIDSINSNLGLHNYEKALELIKIAQKTDSNNVHLFFAEGCCYDNLKKRSLAEISYNKCIEMKPGFPDAYYNLGTLYYNNAIVLYKDASGDITTEESKLLTSQADNELKIAYDYFSKYSEIEPQNEKMKTTLLQIRKKLKLQ